MNRIILIGRLTRDPEVRYTEAGHAVANFTLAVDRKYKDANGERETDFINIVAWRKTAELCGQYLSKGRQCAIDGTLQMRKWETDKGEKRTVYEVLTDSVEFLGGRGESKQEDPGTQKASAEEQPTDDELPF